MKKLKLAEIERLINNTLPASSIHTLARIALKQHEALKFYGAQETYLTRHVPLSCECCSEEKEPPITDDKGKRAREVTAMVEE
jgi:hypothetical protein